LPYISGITFSYNYVLWKPELESFLGNFSILPSVTFVESKKLATVINYKFSIRNFWIEPQDPAYDRDGNSNRVELMQLLKSGGLVAMLSGGFESSNAGVNYDFRGYSAGLRIEDELLKGLQVFVHWSYEFRDYFRHVDDRRDNEIGAGTGMTWSFLKHYSLGLNLTYIKNNSIADYRYQRTLLNLTLGGRF
jgi:hypothetical protein